MTLAPGEQTVRTLTVANLGGNPLDVVVSADDDPAFLSFDPAAAVIPPAGSVDIDVTFDAGALGGRVIDCFGSALAAVRPAALTLQLPLPARVLHGHRVKESMTPAACRLVRRAPRPRLIIVVNSLACTSKG